MRNDTAHSRLYHFQNFYYLLGRLGGGRGGACTVQHNRAKVIPRTRRDGVTPCDRRHLQTACFKMPIYMDFFEFGTKMFRTS